MVKPRWFKDTEYDDTGDYGTTFDNNNTDTDTDTDKNEDNPSPTHECVVCATKIYIQSETRKRPPHYCKQCEEVNYHVKINT